VTSTRTAVHTENIVRVDRRKSLIEWLAALDDFRYWLIGDAA